MYFISNYDLQGLASMNKIVKIEIDLSFWSWPYAGGGKLGCPHGIGHHMGVHACDKCCKANSFKEIWEKRLKSGEWKRIEK